MGGSALRPYEGKRKAAGLEDSQCATNVQTQERPAPEGRALQTQEDRSKDRPPQKQEQDARLGRRPLQRTYFWPRRHACMASCMTRWRGTAFSSASLRQSSYSGETWTTRPLTRASFMRTSP